MKMTNSEHANLMFYGNFVDADVNLEDLEDFLIDVSKFIDETKNRLSSKEFLRKPSVFFGSYLMFLRHS